MLIIPCRECESLNVEWLEQLSKGAWANYYRCPDCGHFWSVWKDERDDAETLVVAHVRSAARNHAGNRFLELRKFLQEQLGYFGLSDRGPHVLSMPRRKCPACGFKHDVQRLAETRKQSSVDYYRCGDCGHVWSVSKNNRTAPSRHITPLRGQRTTPLGGTKK